MPRTSFLRERMAMLLLASLALHGCEDEAYAPLIAVPPWFPAIAHPADNLPTEARIALGRRLFFDPLLSSDSSLSCASCHKPWLAFADSTATSAGVGGAQGVRNTPSLANVAYVPALNADGGVATLEVQALAPIFDPHEMNFSIAGFLSRISADDGYRAMFLSAYGRMPDAFGISRGLAVFQRSLVSAGSRYDRFMHLGDGAALSSAEQRGMALFMSDRAGCSGCHVPPLFTDFSFRNIGLYEQYADDGRWRITLLEADRGRFRVPSLRNVALTAPYMHDGSIATLAEAVQHFNSGGAAHPNSGIAPIGLSEQEMADLMAFLGALTDEGFVGRPHGHR